MKPKISMREALSEPALLGNVMGGSSRYAWRVLLIAAAGEELTDDERETYTKLTGREREPGCLCHELIVAAGRRSGKTSALNAFVVWIACLCDHRAVLAPGEQGVCLAISRDQRAAKLSLSYAAGTMKASPYLSQMIAGETLDSITLTNGISIEMRPCNKISVRGISAISIVADEIGFWFTETSSANPDVEILAACKPALLTTRGPMLLASSVYARRGYLFDSYKRYHGSQGPADIIFAYATSRDLNPSLSQEDIDREIEKDPVRNRAEFLSIWRDDVEGFIPLEVVLACVSDYYELPPSPSICYRCFVDCASGVPEGDSWAIAISHKLGDRVVIDAIREIKPPFSPSEVVNDILVPLCKNYRITSVVGDAYGGEFPRELIRNAGIGSYELAAKHKSQLFADPFLMLLNSRKIDLPKNDVAIGQICSLERRTQPSGRDQIGHAPGGRDDLANAIAGAADLAFNFVLFDQSWSWVNGPAVPQETDEQRKERFRKESEDWHAMRLRRYLQEHGAFGFGPPWGRI
jgi:hypothetical protein